MTQVKVVTCKHGVFTNLPIPSYEGRNVKNSYTNINTPIGVCSINVRVGIHYTEIFIFSSSNKKRKDIILQYIPKKKTIASLIARGAAPNVAKQLTEAIRSI